MTLIEWIYIPDACRASDLSGHSWTASCALGVISAHLVADLECGGNVGTLNSICKLRMQGLSDRQSKERVRKL